MAYLMSHTEHPGIGLSQLDGDLLENPNADAEVALVDFMKMVTTEHKSRSITSTQKTGQRTGGNRKGS